MEIPMYNLHDTDVLYEANTTPNNYAMVPLVPSQSSYNNMPEPMYELHATDVPYLVVTPSYPPMYPINFAANIPLPLTPEPEQSDSSDSDVNDQVPDNEHTEAQREEVIQPVLVTDVSLTEHVIPPVISQENADRIERERNRRYYEESEWLRNRDARREQVRSERAFYKLFYWDYYRFINGRASEQSESDRNIPIVPMRSPLSPIGYLPRGLLQSTVIEQLYKKRIINGGGPEIYFNNIVESERKPMDSEPGPATNYGSGNGNPSKIITILSFVVAGSFFIYIGMDVSGITDYIFGNPAAVIPAPVETESVMDKATDKKIQGVGLILLGLGFLAASVYIIFIGGK